MFGLDEFKRVAVFFERYVIEFLYGQRIAGVSTSFL